MKRRSIRTAACLLLAGTVLATFVAMAAEAGSQGDPLVTLSYLNDTFLGQILKTVDEKLDERDARLRRELDGQAEDALRELLDRYAGTNGAAQGGAVYAPVTLTDGQTLYAQGGCEVLPRSGKALCAAESAGAVDTTAGTNLGGGAALSANHLYLLPQDGAITASGDVTLLVRGSYTVG